MKKFLLLVFLIFILPIAYAESSYDPYSGNFYNVNPQPDGGAQIYGNNFNTGSQWNTTVAPNGNMHGNDANGNYWTYDNSTGFYNNFGTGEMCTGKGAGRICN